MDQVYQIGERAVNVLSGHWAPDMNFFRCVAPMSDNVDFDPPPGRVVHVNASFEFEMGAQGTQLPMILWNSPKDPSVKIPSNSPNGKFLQQAAIPAQELTALPCNSALEIWTTEYDKEEEYPPNALLTCITDNDDAVTGGLVTSAGTGDGGVVEQYSDLVLGIVSRGAYPNEDSDQVLALWTYFLPAAA